MSEGREQDQPEEREGASRPVTAAARRERRATSRPAARKDSKSAEPKSAKSDESEDGAKKGRPTKTRDDQEKRTGLIARFFRFLREVVGELRKVIWPTRKQMITYTGVVLVFVILMTAAVWGLDVGFGWAVFKMFG